MKSFIEKSSTSFKSYESVKWKKSVFGGGQSMIFETFRLNFFDVAYSN